MRSLDHPGSTSSNRERVFRSPPSLVTGNGRAHRYEFLNCLPEAKGRSAMGYRCMRERAHGKRHLPLLPEVHFSHLSFSLLRPLAVIRAAGITVHWAAAPANASQRRIDSVTLRPASKLLRAATFHPDGDCMWSRRAMLFEVGKAAGFTSGGDY